MGSIIAIFLMCTAHLILSILTPAALLTLLASLNGPVDATSVLIHELQLHFATAQNVVYVTNK